MSDITARNHLGYAYTLTEIQGGTKISLGPVSITVPVSQDQIIRDWARWLRDTYIQDAFPYMDADQREFLISGITPEQWDIMFPEEEE